MTSVDVAVGLPPSAPDIYRPTHRNWSGYILSQSFPQSFPCIPGARGDGDSRAAQQVEAPELPDVVAEPEFVAERDRQTAAVLGRGTGCPV